MSNRTESTIVPNFAEVLHEVASTSTSTPSGTISSKRSKYDRFGRDKHGNARPTYGPDLGCFLKLLRGTMRRRLRLFGGHLAHVGSQRHLDLPPHTLTFVTPERRAFGKCPFVSEIEIERPTPPLSWFHVASVEGGSKQKVAAA